jgi:hypothetical protein
MVPEGLAGVAAGEPVPEGAGAGVVPPVEGVAPSTPEFSTVVIFGGRTRGLLSTTCAAAGTESVKTDNVMRKGRFMVRSAARRKGGRMLAEHIQ